MTEQRWIPLESNPEVLNKYMHNLGVPKEWEFVDVYGLEPELLGMVPKPVVAVVMLFPMTEKVKENPIGTLKPSDDSAGLFFVKQTISNACGTIAIVHCLANNEEKIAFIEEKPFKKFLSDCEKLTPDERAKKLGSDQDMGSAHEEVAQEGQTQAPPKEENVKSHFIAFVCKDGGLYELNGCADGPIYHCSSTPDSVLEASASVAKEFMKRDPDEVNFTLMALCDTSSS